MKEYRVEVFIMDRWVIYYDQIQELHDAEGEWETVKSVFPNHFVRVVLCETIKEN